MTPAEIHIALVSCPGPLALDVANELRRLRLVSWGEASPSAVVCTLAETGTMLLRERLRSSALDAAVSTGACFAAFQAALMSKNADDVEAARKKHSEAVVRFCRATDAYIAAGGGS